MRDLSARAVAFAAGCRPEALSQWRFFHVLWGERVGTHLMFSAREAVLCAIVRVLIEFVQTPRACRLVAAHADEILPPGLDDLASIPAAPVVIEFGDNADPSAVLASLTIDIAAIGRRVAARLAAFAAASGASSS